MKQGTHTGWWPRAAIPSMVMLGLAFAPIPAAAKMSLSVSFPDIVMEQVDPGSVINLRQLRGIPYVVTNKSDVAVEVVIEAQTPVLGPGQAKEGYEPLTTPEWLRAVPDKVRLEPGEVASADIILSVPLDPANVGKHWQVNLRSRTTNTGGLALAVQNFLRFSVGSVGPDALQKERNLTALANVKLDMSPTNLRVGKVPMGQKIDISALTGEALKLVNTGKDPVKLRLTSVTVDQSLRQEGYQSTPHPEWLTVKPAVIKVKPNQIQLTKLFLEIPKDPEWSGRKMLFLVRGELEGLSIPLEIHCRIYVTIE